YFRLDFLRDSVDSRCGCSRLYSLLRSMVSAVLQGPPCPDVRGTCHLFSWHPLSAQFLPHSQGISTTPQLCHVKCRTSIRNYCGRSWIRTYEPLACKEREPACKSPSLPARRRLTWRTSDP